MRCRDTVTLAAIVLAAAAAFAGDLNPPAGPVAPTMKRLDQVEPRIAINSVNTPGALGASFRITQPGSYYLTGNIGNNARFETAIFIASSDVTIDLNGFSLLGGPDADGAIVAAFDLFNIAVKNGIVVGWIGPAINLGGVTNARVEDVQVSHCDQGILVGESGRVLRCSLFQILERGIATRSGAAVTDCVVNNCGSHGIQVDNRTLISGCTVSLSGGDGIRGVSEVSALGCTASNNAGSGINVARGGCISDCVCAANGLGIFASEAGSVMRCVARANLDDGISVGTGGVVKDCTLDNNQGDGIDAGRDGIISGNVCRSNGLGATGHAGIFVPVGFANNRIEDNQLTRNRNGLQVESLDNFIARNTARESTGSNYSVAPGNEFAPVLANPGSNGFAGGTPWSNFAY